VDEIVVREHEPSSRRQRSKLIDEEKKQIRERVWDDEEIGEVEIYEADPVPQVDDDTPKRVAAYARVSTLSTDQTSSIEYQTRYYTEKIENEQNWTFAGIYSDEGKSGTSMKKRTEFQRLLADCYAGKVDMIICASVSRFARNVAECLKEVNMLKAKDPKHPVGVYFETENIYTLDPGSGQAFDIHAMLADWESANKSRRMLLSYDQRIMMKHYPVCDLLGYRHTKDGKLIIDEDEAITVRYIFLARLIGQTFTEIANILTEKERPTLTGSTDWTSSKVAGITQNERRWGDLEARKTVVIDYKEGIIAKNTYEKDGVIHHRRNGAMVHNHHQGIVTPQIAKVTHMVEGASDGISDLYVIAEGALKGFVNISPSGACLDDDVIMDASRSVYTDQEYEALQLAKADDGEAGEYEVPHGSTFVNQSIPAITMSNRRIQMNKRLHERFEDSAYVEILYHPLLQMLAFRSCAEDAPNAVCIKDDDGSGKNNFKALSLCKVIYERQGWTDTFNYKLRGVYRNRNGSEIMLFYLDEPFVMPDKASKDKHVRTPQSGVSLRARLKRDQLLHSLSEADIKMSGRYVANDYFQDIPTRAEILKELEELLMSM